MVTRPRIVVAGNLSLDTTVTPDRAMPRAPGGDALYAALGARAWGADVRILTLVGDDYPDDHLARIRSAGIGTGLIRRVTGPTLAYRIAYSADGGRTFEYLSAPERLDATSPGPDDYARIGGADWLHVAAMSIEAQRAAVDEGRRAGVPVSLDPHEEFVVGRKAVLARLAKGTTFMPSELEARLLFPELDEMEPVAFAAEAASRLDAWSPMLVAVKLGELGSVVRSGGVTRRVPACATPVVDPTGAGDAYCGGFVAGWLATRSAVVGALCGSIAAAEAIGHFGAFGPEPLPTLEARIRRAIDGLRDFPEVDPGTAAHALGRVATAASPADRATEGEPSRSAERTW